MTIVTTINRLSDNLIFSLIQEIETTGNYTNPDVRIGRKKVELDNDKFKALGLGKNTYSITGFSLSSLEHIRIQFSRGLASSKNFNEREPSPYHDQILIEDFDPNGQVAETEFLVAANKAIAKYLPGNFARKGPQFPAEQAEFINQQFSQLTASVTDLTTVAAERQVALDRYKLELEADHSKRLSDLDKSYSEQLASLDRKKSELAEIQKALDDREHMHVRRQLREEITSNLESRLQKPLVSSASKSTRNMVALICLGSAAALFGFAFSTQTLFGSTTDLVEKWFIVLKSLLAGAGATGFLAYAVSWLRKTYIDDVALERSLERYSLDVNRASWSIETLMEMSKKEGAEVPSIWVQGVCNDLFTSATPKDDPTALQALGALMDVAGGAEIGPNGTKITLNRKGTKAVARSAE